MLLFLIGFFAFSTSFPSKFNFWFDEFTAEDSTSLKFVVENEIVWWLWLMQSLLFIIFKLIVSVHSSWVSHGDDPHWLILLFSELSLCHTFSSPLVCGVLRTNCKRTGFIKFMGYRGVFFREREAIRDEEEINF